MYVGRLHAIENWEMGDCMFAVCMLGDSML
jgi:hypothetical protein